MKKVALKLDTLRVESFETEPGGGERGTVHAHASEDTQCYQICYSVGGTCGAAPALPRRGEGTAVDFAPTRDNRCCV